MKIQELLKDYVVEKPHPLLEAKTIQIVMVREILDYTVLRTEETREVNDVSTPISVTNGETTRRVAFLATKQKAAESRQLEQLLRTATIDTSIQQGECYLPNNLCLSCPRCGLFGGTNTDSGSEKIGNIRHRIAYGTAFSLMPFQDINSATTFNAVNAVTQKTGQALGTRYAVTPATVFPSIITLRSVTWYEAVLVIKTLLSCRNYGAETRIGGDVRNRILGIAAGWEEVLTPLELTLELYSRCIENTDDPSELDVETVAEILEEYKLLSGNPNKLRIFTPEELDHIFKDATNTELDEQFLKVAYDHMTTYRQTQSQAGKKKK